MRVSLLVLSAFGTAALLAACSDARSPTERRSGPEFSKTSNGDTLGQPSHYISNGATVSVSWYTSDSTGGGGGDTLGGGGGGAWTYGYLQANRNSQVNNEWTSVNWSVSVCDAFGCRSSGGYGSVNADLLRGAGGGRLRLVVNPADYPGAFYVYGDSIGPIDVAWRSSGAYSQRSQGVTEYAYPGYRYRSNGVSEYSSAFATGHLGSYAIPSTAGAEMGTSHSMTISFYR